MEEHLVVCSLLNVVVVLLSDFFFSEAYLLKLKLEFRATTMLRRPLYCKCLCRQTHLNILLFLQTSNRKPGRKEPIS
jgi:hypothetical protein